MNFIKALNIGNALLLIILIVLFFFVYGIIKWIITILIIGSIGFFIYEFYKKWKSKEKLTSNFIYEIDNFLTKDECNNLINKHNNNLKRSEVINSNSISKFRTSSQKWIDNDDELNNKILKLVNKYSKIQLSLKNGESIQFAKYEPTQEYNKHYDICTFEENKDACGDDYNRFGSYRYITVIIYLNDNFNDGETLFNALGRKIKPKQGKALLFYNCILDEKSLQNGLCKRIDDSIHSGLPVDNGEKYILTKWFRIKDLKKNN